MKLAGLGRLTEEAYVCDLGVGLRTARRRTCRIALELPRR